jgi:hypothetical protein
MLLSLFAAQFFMLTANALELEQQAPEEIQRMASVNLSNGDDEFNEEKSIGEIHYNYEAIFHLYKKGFDNPPNFFAPYRVATVFLTICDKERDNVYKRDCYRRGLAYLSKPGNRLPPYKPAVLNAALKKYMIAMSKEFCVGDNACQAEMDHVVKKLLDGETKAVTPAVSSIPPSTVKPAAN